MRIDGGCHCGFVTYEAEIDPERVLVCNCTDCQTLSGSAFRTVAPTRQGGFRLLSGRPTVYVKTAESGAKRHQGFCPTCGTPIYATSPGDEPKIYSVRVGTARQRRDLVPRGRIWCRSALPWVGTIAAIPGNDTQ